MRQVIPELLDTLAHDDPAALRSRRELRLINGIMGNHRWLCRSLASKVSDHTRILELGAGDGTLARRSWNTGIASPQQWRALDIAPAPIDWPSEAHWLQTDLFALSVLPDAEIIVANLFLHHFKDEQLAGLGQLLPDSCRVIIACEPARRRRHTLQGRLLSPLARLSPVTHHDMLVSIQAGFVGKELPQALGLLGWHLKISLTALGAYHLIAWR
jgi:hypothetical protein